MYDSKMWEYVVELLLKSKQTELHSVFDYIVRRHSSIESQCLIVFDKTSLSIVQEGGKKQSL